MTDTNARAIVAAFALVGFLALLAIGLVMR
jgi:hypothetical protein